MEERRGEEERRAGVRGAGKGHLLDGGVESETMSSSAGPWQISGLRIPKRAICSERKGLKREQDAGERENSGERESFGRGCEREEMGGGSSASFRISQKLNTSERMVGNPLNIYM